MPFQNRVTPEGDLIATPHRGLMMGNRGGAFHRPDQTLSERRWATRQWICCVLAFKDRRREVLQPNRYTELFFLDEATALAAGHRPCFECRRADAERFAGLWAMVHGGKARAPEMDEVLQRQRVRRDRSKVTRDVRAWHLPDGVFVRYAPDDAPAAPYLVDGDRLLAWSPAGYTAAVAMPRVRLLEVLTPGSIVAVLSAGYRPMVHPSIAALPRRPR